MRIATRFLDSAVCGLRRVVVWNDQAMRSLPTWAVGVLAMLVAAAFLYAYVSRGNGFEAPPNPATDERDYDSLGWELSQGHGFQIDFSSPSFRQPYSVQAAAIPAAGPRPCLYRPPLYPALLSLTDRWAGRQFGYRRWWNIVFTAVTCGVVCGLAYRLGGPAPALLAGVHLLIVDWRIRFYSRELLTESLAALLVILLTLLLLRHSRRGSLWTAAAIGVLAGLCTLNRSICLLWIPFLAWMSRPAPDQHGLTTESASESRGTLPGWLHSILVVVVAGVTVAPWAVRNIQLLGWEFPLGTQAALEAPAGYGEGALRRLGLWVNLHREHPEEANLEPAELVAAERQRAVESKAQAVRWAVANWYQLPLLAAVKVFSELRPWGIGELYLSAFAALGLLGLRANPLVNATVGLLTACLVAIALTWSTAGRFLVPLLPNLHVLAALGAWSAVRSVVFSTTECISVSGK